MDFVWFYLPVVPTGQAKKQWTNYLMLYCIVNTHKRHVPRLQQQFLILSTWKPFGINLQLVDDTPLNLLLAILMIVHFKSETD